MPPITPGTETTIIQPWLYYAPRRTPMPGPMHGFRDALAAPWKRLQNFDDESAIIVDFNNPKIKIKTQDNGVIGANPSNDDSINVAVAALQTPSGDILRKASGLVATVAEAVTTVGEERARIEGWHFDPNVEQNFMILIEGIAKAGGLFDVDTKVYFVCYNVEPGEAGGGRGGRGGGGGGGGRSGGGGGRGRGAQPGQISMNYKGENAHVQVALPMEALPEPGIADVFPSPAPVLAEREWPSTLIDPYKRANFFNVASIE